MITRSKTKQQKETHVKDYKPDNLFENIKLNNNKEVIVNTKIKNTKVVKPSPMVKLMKKLNIDETFTKRPTKGKYDTIKENTLPVGGYNYMSDLLELPITKEGYKYLLVVVDIWNNNFDIEPMKSKTASDTLDAFKTIIKRQFTKMPKASIRTDNGNEFKGSFKAFLTEHDILHRVALPYRHKQMSNVESLNALLGRIFMTYLTNKELEFGKQYKEWTDILKKVRIELNNARYSPDDIDPYNTDHIPYNIEEPKFKKGDIVAKKMEVPKNLFGKVEADTKFRKGDLRFNPHEKLKIVKVLNYPQNNRYVLNNYPNVSYTQNELKPVEQKEEYFLVKEIINKKILKGKIYYRVWWKNKFKKESTWELESNLLKDGLKDYIDYYNSKI